MSPPKPWSSSSLAAARETRNEPLVMTSCCRSQSSSVVSSTGLLSDRPALLTTTSTPPKARAVAASACATSPASVTSTVTATATSAAVTAPTVAAISSAASAAARPSRSATTTQAPSAASRKAVARPDPRPPAGDERDPTGQRLGPGPAGQLRLLEGPVLDPELLGLVDRCVLGDGLRTAHGVDRVDVVLARDAGRLGVRTEAEHPHAGDEHDGRVRAAHRRGVRRRVALVVGAVVEPVLLVELPEAAHRLLRVGVRRQVEDQWPDLGAQEVVGTRGAERGEAAEAGPGEEVQHRGAVVVVAHERPAGRRPDASAAERVGAGQPSQDRRQGGGPGVTQQRRERLVPGPHRPEGFGPAALRQEAFRAADDLGTALLALGAGAAPGGDAVAAQDAPDRLRVLALDAGDVEPQLEARP